MWNRGFLLLCVLMFLIGLVVGPVLLLFPVYAGAILVKDTLFAALLRSVPIGLGGISAMLGGIISDRFGRKFTLLLGMTGAIAIGGLFTTQTPLFIWGVLCYEGVASGFKTAGGQSYLIGAVPARQLGLATSLYFMSTNVGSAVGNALAGEVITRVGYPAFGWGAIFLLGFLFLCACLVLPPLKQAGLVNGVKSVAVHRPNLRAYVDLCRRRDMRMLIGLRFLPTYYWGSVNLLMPVLISRVADVKTAGYYGTISLLFALVCQLAVGKICDTVGHRAPAFVANLLVTVLTFGVVFFHKSLVALEFFGVLGTGAAWALSTTIPRFINEFTAPAEKGHGVGLTHFAWSTGFLAGYVASGFLIEISVQVPFIVAGIFLMFSTVIAYTLCQDTH